MTTERKMIADDLRSIELNLPPHWARSLHDSLIKAAGIVDAPATQGQLAELDVLRKALNRRAEVEQYLLNVANGKRPMLTLAECRTLAMRLGDPTSKEIQNV